MRPIPLLLTLAGLACLLFSYWGLNTVAGRATFDEMAGMIPLAAAPVGLAALCAAAWIGWRGSRP